MSEKSEKNEVRSKAHNPIHAMNDAQRKLIGQAIIDKLIDPGSFTFTSPLATEGGDYNQNGGGGYTQSGGGNHNQAGPGDYNQAAQLGRFDQVEITNVMDLLRRIETLRR